MAISTSPKVATNGLVFAYDMYNTIKSWKGQPTTNLVGDSMSIYNNVPSDVTASLTTTGEYYRGAPIYKLTLTPTTASGVSYLTGGNNPGIGVVSGGGGGTASRYTGHAIFYKPTVPMSSTPLFTNYSNIGGWGAGSMGSNRSVNMGDGWFRGEVIWYDTTTRSDGKYWAINPATATLNIPIDIYWAGPFKEDRNDSDFVSPYVPSSRSSTQAVIDQTGNYTITASGLTYSRDGSFSFNGSTDKLTLSSNTVISGTQDYTVESVFKASANSTDFIFGNYGSGNSAGLEYYVYQNKLNNYISGNVQSSTTLIPNTVYVSCVTRSSGTVTHYLNGVADGSATNSNSIATNNPFTVGNGHDYTSEAFGGNIYNVKVYNRALSAAEVKQNYTAIKETIFGYQPLTLVNSSNITLTNNGTKAVTITKNADNNTWNGQAYSTQSFTAPCTIEFTKTAASGDNGVSYAMIGWNTDPTTDASYASIDHAAYPYRQDNYSVYNNGSQVNYSGVWSPNNRFYIVYDTDGYIRHYNGSTLLYSANYGTGNIVYLDSSLYNTDTTYCKFTDVMVCRKSWNGRQYV